MKILYAIQGTGNGHLSRAREIIPHLQKRGELDLLVSGLHGEIQLDYPIKYKFLGLGYFFGKNGGIDYWRSIKALNISRLLYNIFTVPLKEYDLIINDFEPISAWACKLRGYNCVSLSHQAAYLSKNVPRPEKRNWISELILKYYAPSNKALGLHFRAFDSFIYTPVIRQEVRRLEIENKDHYTVYLPSYSDEILIDYLSSLGDYKWHIFSKHCKNARVIGKIKIFPVHNNYYLESLRTCLGVLMGAGFEGPAEAMFLKKKLLIIPMKGQYEQQCNAAGLVGLGVPAIYDLTEEYRATIHAWLRSSTSIEVDYPDHTEKIMDQVFSLAKSN